MIISTAEFIISNTNVALCPKEDLPEFAFIGRSNVGKSSLINMLTKKKGLAMTSSKPGKTLLINHFLINKTWHIVDLPGYGYAKTGKSQRAELRKIIESYILKRAQLYNLYVLLDSRLPPQKIDLEFMHWLGENEIPFSIIFTKTDKQSTSHTNENIAAYKKTLLEEWEELPDILQSSAEKESGRDEILNHIDSILSQQ